MEVWSGNCDSGGISGDGGNRVVWTRFKILVLEKLRRIFGRLTKWIKEMLKKSLGL